MPATYMPGPVVGAANMELNKTMERVPAHMEIMC